MTTTKLNFGKLKKAETKSKTEYPIHPDKDGEFAVLATELIRLKGESDKFADGKKQFCGEAMPYYFEYHSQKRDVSSSLEFRTDGKSVLVTPQNRYRAMDDVGMGSLADIDANIPDYFQSTFEIKVNGDKLPFDKAQDIIDDLAAVFGKYECEDAISYNQRQKPIETFHAARHQLFDIETNLRINEVCPCVASFKVR